MNMDSERTTRHDVIQMDTIDVNLNDKTKGPIVEGNPVEKVVPAANDHEASSSRSQYFLTKWCPLGLTRTQRRKLQRLRCHERKEKELEQHRDEYFNKCRPMIPQKKEWRVKIDEQSKTTPQAIRPGGAGGLTSCDIEATVQAVRLPVQAVRPGDVEELPGDVSPTPMVCDNKLTSATNIEDDEQLVVYSSSPEHKNMDINVPCMGDYVLMEENVRPDSSPEKVG